MKIRTVRALEELGRVRLSRSFFMRDFLHSEIANFYGMPNIPDDPELAIHVGKRLCEDLLEVSGRNIWPNRDPIRPIDLRP